MSNPKDMIYILSQQTTDVTTNTFYLDLSSSKAVVTVWGTWDGASIVIQVGTVPTLDGNTTWITVTDRLNIPFNFTEDTTITFTEFVYSQPLRAVLTNAGASTNLNCTLQVI